MLETFTAITTSITAILSVYIAFKSHRTTINERKREKKEFSIKLMDFHESKNKQYLNLIFFLSELDIQLNESMKIYNYIFNKNLDSHINKYIKNTEKFKEEKIDQLNLNDTKILSNSISKSKNLSNEISRLVEIRGNAEVREIMLNHHGNIEEIYHTQNEKIQKTAKELLNVFN